MASNHPVRILLLDDDLERGRWSSFFRLFLALPHLMVLSAFATVAILLLPIMWIATLIRAEPPHSFADLYGRIVIYAAQVEAYLHLAAAPFPPFLGAHGSYPIDLELPLPERQNRWSIGFRGLLAFPALALAGALGGGAGGSGARYVSFAGVLPTLAFLGWFVCVVRKRLPPGFRDLMVYAFGYIAQVYAYMFLITGRYPNSDPSLAPAAPLPDHPVTLSAAGDDLRRSRLTVFFRGLLVLPHLVWLTLWAVVAIFAAFAAWVAALATGRVPGALHRFLAAFVRYATHVSAFLYLVANPFPGFTGAAGRYPIELEIGGPEVQGRWTVLFRSVLAIPAILVSSALGSVVGVAAVMAWFASLFTARMPLGVRNLMAFSLRYSAQVSAYMALLTPHYPYSGPGHSAPPAAPELGAAAEALA